MSILFKLITIIDKRKLFLQTFTIDLLEELRRVESGSSGRVIVVIVTEQSVSVIIAITSATNVCIPIVLF